MKAISLLQPWATLCVIGRKQFETRSWQTKYRGRLLIHASAGKSRVNQSIMLDFQQEFVHLQLPHYEDLPFGVIIGSVELLDIYSTEAIRKIEITKPYITITKQEEAFGDYSEGRFMWEFADPIVFKNPIPCKGALSIWEVPSNILIPQ